MFLSKIGGTTIVDYYHIVAKGTVSRAVNLEGTLPLISVNMLIAENLADPVIHEVKNGKSPFLGNNGFRYISLKNGWVIEFSPDGDYRIEEKKLYLNIGNKINNLTYRWKP